MDANDLQKKLIKYIPNFKSRIERIQVNKIKFNDYNPRKKFSQEKEDELIESINARGVLVPIIVYEKKRQ